MKSFSIRQFAITAALALSFHSGFAQTPAWTNSYTAAGHVTNIPVAAVTDTSGNLYVAGYTADPGVNNGWILFKYSSAGALQWQTTYAGSPSGDRPAVMKIDVTGNIYVAGTVYSTTSSNDIALAKFDPAGNLLWACQYVRTQGDDKANDLAFDSAGNIFVVGRGYVSTTCDFHHSMCYADTVYLTLKYDSAGNLLWTREFFDSLGNQDAQSVVVDTAGNAYVAGVSVGVADPRAPGFYFKVIKYAPNGTQLTIITPLSLMTGSGLDVSIRATLGPTNELYIAANTRMYFDVLFVQKYTNDVQAWTATYNANPYGGPKQIQSIVADSQSNLYLLGSTPNTNNVSACLLMRYDSNGDLLWANLHNRIQTNAEYGVGLTLDNFGTPWVTAFSSGPDNTSAYSTLEYSPSGSLLWEANYLGQGNNANEPKALALTLFGTIYVTGTSSSSSGKAITTLQYLQIKSRITANSGTLNVTATANPGSINYLQISHDLTNWSDACSGITGPDGICTFPCLNTLLTNPIGYFRISQH